MQAQVSERHRETDPQRKLNPDQQTGFEGVTVLSDVELRNNTTQVLLELEPGHRIPENPRAENDRKQQTKRTVEKHVCVLVGLFIALFVCLFVSYLLCFSVQPLSLARTETSYRSLFASSEISTCSASTCTSPGGYYSYHDGQPGTSWACHWLPVCWICIVMETELKHSNWWGINNQTRCRCFCSDSSAAHNVTDQ